MADAKEHLEKAERFLATARLAQQARDFDSCASRAAYALHHACIALLLHNGMSETSSEASKPKIQTDFATLAAQRYPLLNRFRFVEKSKGLRQSLSDVSSLRNDADYRVPGVSRGRASAALEFARRVVGVVKEITE